ncbi:MAG TPA: GYF domain-containing protein [Steroidobacteraceae bacterium]|nr:GYF domain-containing protein [Steroidobacteraceae bacterium]
MSTEQWFIGRAEERYGPYRREVLKLLAEHGKLAREDLLWTQGMSEWARADSIPEFAPLFGEGAAAPPDALIESGNYFIRHWRGQLSLPISYWINGALLTVALLAAIGIVRQSGVLDDIGARRTGLWVLGVFAVGFAASVWQFVGIWRSATRHPSTGGSRGWAIVAKVMVVLGLLRLAGFSIQEAPMMEQGFLLALGRDRTTPSQLHVVNHGTEIEVAGGMSFGTTDAVQKLLVTTPTIRIVQLNNSGGFITEGERLGQLINAHGLSTYTARACVSACLLAFMGGRERFLSSSGRLGFHEASVAGVGGEVAKAGTESFRRIFLARGIPSSFIERALATPASSMWFPSTQELLDAHVITKVVDGRDFALTVHGTGLQAAFDAVPLFAALKSADPAAYGTLRDTFINGTQEGISQGEMFDKVRRIMIDTVLPRYLQSGPDRELIDYWHTQITEMRELRTLDPQLCADFLVPTQARGTLNLSQHLSKQSFSADLERLTRLIAATAVRPARVPTRAAIQTALRSAADQAELRDRGALKIIQNPQRESKIPLRFCNAELAFFDSILALPTNQAGPILRYLSAAGHHNTKTATSEH